MNTPDPLEPRIYLAEGPVVEPPQAAPSRSAVPWQLRAPGAAVPWGPACGIALVAAALACLIATVELLLGGPRTNVCYIALAGPWMTMHLGRVRRRWCALAAALPFFAAALAVGGYLQAPLLAALVIAYTGVTHIPTRGRSAAVTPYRRGPDGGARRAAGTISLTDVARSIFTNQASPRPQDDLADMSRGTTLYVTAGSGRRGGRLVLEPDRLSWQPHRRYWGYGPATPLERPVAIDLIERRSRVGFQRVAITAATRLREFTVPELDVDLLRAYVLRDRTFKADSVTLSER